MGAELQVARCGGRIQPVRQLRGTQGGLGTEGATARCDGTFEERWRLRLGSSTRAMAFTGQKPAQRPEKRRPQIHEEGKRNLLAKRLDLAREQIDRTSVLIDQAILDGLVTDHEDLVAGLTPPDPGDRHVLAAAIRCSASAAIASRLLPRPNSSASTTNLTRTRRKSAWPVRSRWKASRPSARPATLAATC